MQWSLFVLILMGQCSFCLCLLHEYHFVRERKTWEEAQTYCREHYTDLAKVFDMTDLKRLTDSASNQGEAWIGLHNQNNVNRKWLWSLPGVKFNDSETEWDDDEPYDIKHPENCVVMTDHEWQVDPCDEGYQSICYDEKNQKQFHLISEWTSWLKAQSYCREHHTDLVSGLTQLNDKEFKNEIESAKDKQVWIGLFRDTWRWSDESNSSFRFWDPDQFNDKSNKKCAMTVSNGKWSSNECNNRKPFFCYDNRPLQCQKCTDEQCSNTTLVTCSSETMCVTASIQANSSGTPAQQIFKACASSSLCPATGSHTFSANLGVLSAVASTKCCNTYNCNTETLPFPAAQTVNSLECFTCNPVTSQCTSQVQCRGEENLCFQASVTSGSSTSPALGCVSTNMCAAAESLGSLPFMQSLGSISSGPSCCGTSFCNNATITAPPTTTTTTPTPTTSVPTTAITTTTTTPTPPIVAPTPTTAGPTTTTQEALEPDCNATMTDEVILIKENKTWEQALTYCRENHRDLISITNSQKQRCVGEVDKQANSPYVWTGLRYTCTLGFWFWITDERVSYKNWELQDEMDECDMSGAMATGGEHKWFKKNADEKFNFICTKL